MEYKNANKNTNSMKNQSSEIKNSNRQSNKAQDKINLDYDWNSEYGDGDIPDIDKQ